MASPHSHPPQPRSDGSDLRRTANVDLRERPLSPALLARMFHQPAIIYFKDVAECLSVRECSRRLNVASSAVSRQITHLEQALGLTLFQRDGRRLRLTPAGEILHRHIRRVAAPLEAAVSELDSLRGLKTGSVRIATAETVGLSFLPALLTSFAERYPTVHLDVSVASSSGVIAAVAAEHADVGFAFVTRPPTAVQMTIRREVRVGALMRDTHPLAKVPELTLAQCLAHPAAIGKAGLSIRDAIDPLIAPTNLLNLPLMEVGSNALLVELARIGRHVSIITSIGISNRENDGLVFRYLEDRELPRHFFGVVVRASATLHFAVAAFHDHARHHMAGVMPI